MSLKPLVQYPAEALDVLFCDEVEVHLLFKIFLIPFVIFFALVAAVFNLK